jgi:peroxiredoxin
MAVRLRTFVPALGAVLGVFALFFVLNAEEPASSVGKMVASFTLPDTTGRPVALADFKDRRAVVVLFLGTQCPINNLYAAHLGELHKEFAPQGVQFLAINANQQDGARDIAEHARKYELPFPVLRDEGNVIADRFGATRTPEAFVLDAQRVVRYQGRIDNHFGIGYQRPKATRRDLAQALTEVLAGRTVSVPTTPVAGCFIGRATRKAAEGTITFSKHVAPILQNRCQECHRPGQIGPMPLLTYDDASAWADTIREVIQEKRMPPWYADPRHGKWSNDRSLTSTERDMLLAWVAQGAPRGDDRDMPPAKHFAEGWRIGEPDAVLTMPKAFNVPAETPRFGIPYKHFFVETNFPEDRWVERAEAKAGATEVVHHIVVFIVPPEENFFPGNPRTPALSGTAPGDMPLILPKGAAKHLPKGSRLVFQMHYTPNGKAQADRSSIALIFAKEPPQREVITVPVANPVFQLSPGADNVPVEAWYTMKRDGYIVGFMPHMHLRGKDFLYDAIYPDGKTERLLSVPRYSFGWQSIYRPAEPVMMPKGTRIHCVAHFDNSAGNANNPDPTATVRWGDQTWEEMMIGWIDFAYDRKAR